MCDFHVAPHCNVSNTISAISRNLYLARSCSVNYPPLLHSCYSVKDSFTLATTQTNPKPSLSSPPCRSHRSPIVLLAVSARSKTAA
ncbi:Kelch-like 30 [Sesbania bispinosa]|nr:Kelch-like 30 [Sesbania bispinosa]